MIDDEEIVKMYLQRDENAIGHTQTKYGTKLRAVSHGITADICAAEEVENDTYLKAWESIPPNEPYKTLFVYLMRIVRNLSLNVCRNRSRLKRSAVIVELSEEMEQCIPAAGLVDEEYDGKLLAEKISRFLDGKSSRKRDIFMRRYWFLDSEVTIAKRFGLSENNVKVILFRMRRELKEYLESDGYFI